MLEARGPSDGFLCNATPLLDGSDSWRDARFSCRHNLERERGECQLVARALEVERRVAPRVRRHLRLERVDPRAQQLVLEALVRAAGFEHRRARPYRRHPRRGRGVARAPPAVRRLGGARAADRCVALRERLERRRRRQQNAALRGLEELLLVVQPLALERRELALLPAHRDAGVVRCCKRWPPASDSRHDSRAHHCAAARVCLLAARR